MPKETARIAPPIGISRVPGSAANAMNAAAMTGIEVRLMVRP